MKKLFFYVVVLAISGITIQAQTVRFVDNNQGAPTASGVNYTDIQAAVDASSPGDIIYIQPSPNNYGNITMTKRLNIYGIAHNPELNAGQRPYVPNIYFNGAAAMSKISGLYVSNIYLSYNFNNNGVVISNNEIIGEIQGPGNTTTNNDIIIVGNYFNNAGGSHSIDNNSGQNWTIANNLFYKNHTQPTYQLLYRLNNTTLLNNNIILTRQNGDSNQSIEIFLNCNATQISNNIFIFTGNNVANMNLGGNTSLLFNNNLTYNVTSPFDALAGSNNIDDTNPQFVSFDPSLALKNPSNDFHIQGGSPAQNAGSDGNDLGVFNGAYPFSIRGYPTELPYLTDFVIFNNILSEGTDLNINVKANANNN